LLLNPLASEEIKQIVLRALQDREHGLGGTGLEIEDEALTLLASSVDGDCRRALNCLETAATIALKRNKQEPVILSEQLICEAMQERTLRYDRAGEEHYNLISALHKSLRDSDPDGACYWLGRMLAGGEDPLYIARRLIRFASEDIGNGDPKALEVAINCRHAYTMLGSPEGELALYQATAYLATAPKSNAVYMTEKMVKKEIRRSGSLPVPLHLRNAPTRLMADVGYGKNYRYAHDNPDGLVAQEHLPEQLSGKVFYQPTNRGYEAVIRDRLIKWRKILKQRAQDQKNAEKKTNNN
jgi:putative ATPase